MRKLKELSLYLVGACSFLYFCPSISAYSLPIIAPKTGGSDDKRSSVYFIKDHETTTLDDVAKR